MPDLISRPSRFEPVLDNGPYRLSPGQLGHPLIDGGSMNAFANVRSSRMRSVLAAEPQSCRVEGCAGIVRRRERQNHAFAP